MRKTTLLLWIMKTVLPFIINKIWLPLVTYLAVKHGIHLIRFKKCPFCAEKIKKDAIVCKYCKLSVEKQ